MLTREEALKQSFHTIVVSEEKKEDYYHVRIVTHEEFINEIFNGFEAKLYKARNFIENTEQGMEMYLIREKLLELLDE